MDVEERVEELGKELVALRRRNRYFLFATVFTLGLASASGFLGLRIALAEKGASPCDSLRAKVIWAREFVLEDEKGRTRATLGYGHDPVEEFSCLRLCDENGKERIALANGVLGARLVLQSDYGKGELMLDNGKEGPGLCLFDENGENRAALCNLKDGPQLYLTDGDRKIRLQLYCDKVGPGLNFMGGDGKLVWSAAK